MFSLETSLLGVALAIDAAVVCFAVGLLEHDISLKHKLSRGAMLATLFGFFQFFMMWLGSFAGYFFSFSEYGYMFQIVVAMIFIGIAMKALQESFKKDDGNDAVDWGLAPMLVLALATSVDALAAGVSLGSLPMAYLSAMEVGFITFMVCLIGFGGSFFLRSFPFHWLLRLAAGIFFFLGGRIIINHYF